jgi:osmotically-inducible protein OsmY
MTKTDAQLKQDLEAELDWDPKVNASQVTVTVEKGGVSLSGMVDTYGEKWAAEAAAKRVSGVVTLSQELKVKLSAGHQRSDAAMESAVRHALEWDVEVPDTIIGSVFKGFVTLSGTAGWNFQRQAASRAVRNLTGLAGLSNEVVLALQPSAQQVKEQVRAALQRQAVSDASTIEVQATTGGRVTLTGRASSWQSIEDATAAAWAAPGVTEVVDRVRLSMTP